VLYLWLCCEGWQSFGPFQHLHISATTITDEEEQVVAFRDDEGVWYTPGIFCCYRWRSPMVTPSPIHPHPNRGKA
jgi:hypothetical protein